LRHAAAQDDNRGIVAICLNDLFLDDFLLRRAGANGDAENQNPAAPGMRTLTGQVRITNQTPGIQDLRGIKGMSLIF
jgi:hypothetical protein